MKQSFNPPVYSQVAFDIAAKIAAGEWKEGERFTGRSLMSSQYNVSSETIRRAMRLLEEMGILSVQVNVGYTVLSKARAVEYIEQFQNSRDLRQMKLHLEELVAQRNALNEEISQTMKNISDLGDRFRYSGRLRTYEYGVDAASQAVGQSIGQLQFRQKTGSTIVAVQKRGEIILSPDPQTVLEAGDTLVVACELSSLNQVSQLLGAPGDGGWKDGAAPVEIL